MEVVSRVVLAVVTTTWISLSMESYPWTKKIS